jgi:hypothetical protein
MKEAEDELLLLSRSVETDNKAAMVGSIIRHLSVSTQLS